MWSTIGMMIWTSYPAMLLTAAVAYLLGSFNSAITVSLLLGRGDIRDCGSGNAGATNMLRSYGKFPALLTAVGDLAKTVLAVMLGEEIMRLLGDASFAVEMRREFGAYLAGCFCVVGHLYPLYYGFRGGKGVVAAFALALVLDWKVALCCLAVFAVVVWPTKFVSLGSCAAGVAFIVLTYLSRRFVYHQDLAEVTFCTIAAAVVTALLIVKHIPNIRRLLRGTESRISLKDPSDAKEE